MSESQVFKNGNEEESSFRVTKSFTAKVFLYLFLGLILSAVVCLGLSYFLYDVLSNGSIEEAMSQLWIYLMVMIGAGIGILITSIVISVKQIKMRNILAPYIIYSLLMGIMLSGFVVFIGDPNIVGVALAISSVLFLTMCIFGFLFKGRLGWILGLFVGGVAVAFLLWIVNLFLFPFAFSVQSAYDASLSIYWAIEYIFLGLIMISTFIDMYRIRKISESGAGSNNLAMYCALSLYSDFIVLFIRVIYILLLSSRRND